MKRFACFVMIIAVLLGTLPAAWGAEDCQSWVRAMEHTGDYRYGFQDSEGNWMIRPRYDWVQEFEESGYAVVQVGQGENARSGLIDASGAYVLRPEYADLGSDYTGSGLRFFRREPGELWGIMADDGTVLVEPFLAADDWVSDFEAGVARYRTAEGKYGMVSGQGQLLGQPIYDEIWYPQNGALSARKGELWGTLDLEGQEQVPFRYTSRPEAGLMAPQPLALVRDEEGGLGAVSLETGEEVLPCLFQSAGAVGSAVAVGASDPEELGRQVDLRGREAGLEVTWYPQFEYLSILEGTGRMMVQAEGRYGVYGLDGRCYVEPIYSGGIYLREDGVVTGKDGKWGWIDLDGNELTEFCYDSMDQAIASREDPGVRFVGKWPDQPPYALADKEGKLLTGYDFWHVGGFFNGVARVSDLKGERFGYLDVDGRMLTSFQYDYLSGFFEADGFAVVHSYEKGYNVIDRQGREILPQVGTLSVNYSPWRAGYGIWGYVDGDRIGFVDGDTGEQVVEARLAITGYTGKNWPPANYCFDENGYMQVWEEKDGRLIEYTIDRTGAPAEAPEPREERPELTWSNPYGDEWGTGGWGCRDRAGKWIVPPLYDQCGSFVDGYSLVWSRGVCGLLKEPVGEPSPWAAEELALAREAGLIPADCESFPAYPITRAQFASLAVNYLEKATGETVEPAEADTFTDTAAEAVRKAYAAGIVQGVGEGKFDPDSLLTREELAVMLWRAMGKAGDAQESLDGLSGYTDGDQAADWARESLGALTALGVLNGTGTGALAPKEVCTVEQAVLLVFRAAN